MPSFKFQLATTATITASGESGEIIGRSEYSSGAQPSYLIRYRCADGRAVEAWWSEDALSSSTPTATS